MKPEEWAHIVGRLGKLTRGRFALDAKESEEWCALLADFDAADMPGAVAGALELVAEVRRLSAVVEAFEHDARAETDRALTAAQAWAAGREAEREAIVSWLLRKGEALRLVPEEAARIARGDHVGTVAA